MQHGKRQIGEVAFLRVGMAHGLGNDFVAVAERHAFFHQIIRQIGAVAKPCSTAARIFSGFTVMPRIMSA